MDRIESVSENEDFTNQLQIDIASQIEQLERFKSKAQNSGKFMMTRRQAKTIRVLVKKSTPPRSISRAIMTQYAGHAVKLSTRAPITLRSTIYWVHPGKTWSNSTWLFKRTIGTMMIKQCCRFIRPGACLSSGTV